MRHNIFAATATVVVAIAAILGGNMITREAPKVAAPPLAAPFIDLAQIMKDAKDLPEAHFDAF